MRILVLSFILMCTVVSIFFVDGCRPKDSTVEIGKSKKDHDNLGQLAALPDSILSPGDNPQSPEKIELGRLLFYDPILSGNKDVACASCHHPEFMYAESQEISIGVNGSGLSERRKFKLPNSIPFTKRNSQTILNTAFNGIDVDGNYDPTKAPMFWDLRASSLEEQALFPVKSLEEMRGTQHNEEEILEIVRERLNANATYRKLFQKAFRGSKLISIDMLAKSLASFQRSLIANNSRFDRYMRGDAQAMTAREIEGMNLFISSGCARCHNGPMFSDFKPHVLGVADNEKLGFSDSGFQKTYAFRTPSLRNLRFTRPYMHSGKIQTLENVLTFYDDINGKDPLNKNVKPEQIDSLARKLNVEFKNINAIIEFLNALNDEKYDRKIPQSVPSGLPVGGNIK